MLGKLFKKNKSLGKAYIIRFHVKPMEGTIMPPELGGAYISCFSIGEGYEESMKKCIDKLAVDGLYPEEVLDPVHEIEIADWTKYVDGEWPEYKNNLANQSEFEEKVLSGGVEYGPFAGYNHQPVKSS